MSMESFREGNKLHIIVNLDRELEGEERISKSGKSIFVAKHKSYHKDTLGDNITIVVQGYKKNK